MLIKGIAISVTIGWAIVIQGCAHIKPNDDSPSQKIAQIQAQPETVNSMNERRDIQREQDAERAKQLLANTETWRLEWFEGFKHDQPQFSGRPFDFSRTYLKTHKSDVGDWYGFSGGCNDISRFPMSRRDETDATSEPIKWGVGTTQVGCAEAVEDKTKVNGVREVLSRSDTLEHLFMARTGELTDRRADVILSENELIWLGKDGQPFAKFYKN